MLTLRTIFSTNYFVGDGLAEENDGKNVVRRSDSKHWIRVLLCFVIILHHCKQKVMKPCLKVGSFSVLNWQYIGAMHLQHPPTQLTTHNLSILTH